MGYFGLFGGSFAAATILPLASEVILLGFFNLGYPIWLCVAVATVGNTLGGVTNYLLGRFASSEKVLHRFKLNSDRLNKWETRTQKWGHFLGLLAWIPFVGDPMIVALGFFKAKFWPLLAMMFIGKLIRYVIIGLLFMAII